MKIIKFIICIFLLLNLLPIYSDDFNIILQKAEQGNAMAQSNLAYMYIEGNGVPQNYAQAVYWFRKAAEQGNEDAQCLLAEMLMRGEGIPCDTVQAAHWFRKAAEQGNAMAQYNLGVMCEFGDGVPQNYAQALDWYRKAAEQGFAMAQTNLGDMYELGKGLPIDYAQAIFWYRKAAEQGVAMAQSNLAYMYVKGNGVPQNYTQALYWYRKAAEQGFAMAQSNLAYMYIEGKGVSKDYAMAAYWYRKAAEQGNAEAQYNLGYMYNIGQGLPIDYEQAIFWYHKAAEQGDTKAQYNLGIIYEYGEGVPIDYSIAMMWYKKALDAEGDDAAREQYNSLAAKGYKESPIDPLQSMPKYPILSLKNGSVYFTDASNNNSIAGGEDCHIGFNIKNNGDGDAKNCVVRIILSGMTNGIYVNDVKLPTIVAGQEYGVTIPVMANTDTQDGNVTFTIEVYEPNGWGIAPFDLTVATKAFEQPLLQVVDYNVASASGKIRKMEPFTLTFNLQNIKYGDAEDVKVKVNLPSNIFVMDGSAELSYPLIKSGEVKPIQITLAANNNYSTTNIPISIDVKEKHGKFAENKQLDIALNQTTSSSITIAAKDEPKQEHKEIQIAMIKSDVDRNIPVTNAKNPNTFVLIIANEHYQQVASVPYALNDGNIFKEYCIKTLGVSEKHLHYIPDATINHIKAQVNWLANITETWDDPQVIVYYAGHGIPDEASKTAYLLPIDGSGTDVSTGYKLDDLYTTLGNMPASRITVFMDACFSGSKREEGMLASARGVALKAKSGVPQGNMVVFSAAQGDETAYPNREQQHGLFTYYLLKKLQETEGNVELKELGDYVTKQVSQQSLLLNSKKQTPCVTPSATVGTEWQSWKLK